MELFGTGPEDEGTQEGPAWLWDDTATAAASHTAGRWEGTRGPRTPRGRGRHPRATRSTEPPALPCLAQLSAPGHTDEQRGPRESVQTQEGVGSVWSKAFTVVIERAPVTNLARTVCRALGRSLAVTE